VCSADRCTANADGETQAVDWCAQKKQINGAMVHITGIFGFTIAGTILRDLAGLKAIPAPKIRKVKQ
jgi:tRNA A37 threonylcarbamoyladenosine dehydratase